MISITEAQITAWLMPVFWPFLRVLGMLGSSPVFSLRAIPARAKIGMAFLIALCAQAGWTPSITIGFNDPAALGTVVHEVLIGLAIGFAVRLVFASIELAGELMGLQMGLNFALFFDMTTSSQVSAVSRFFGTMAVLLFVAVNGHLLVLMAVFRSYEAFPLHHSLIDTFERLKLYQMGAEIFSTALWIALPLVGMLLLVNLTMGIVSRIAPQMNIFAIGFPVTLSVGLLGIAAGLPLLESPMMTLMERTIDLFAPR